MRRSGSATIGLRSETVRQNSTDSSLCSWAYGLAMPLWWFFEAIDPRTSETLPYRSWYAHAVRANRPAKPVVDSLPAIS